MQTSPTTEDTGKSNEFAPPLRKRLAIMWIWPVIGVLITFNWWEAQVGLRLLYKSTWVLFLGTFQSWLLVFLNKDKRRPEWLIPLLSLLTIASIFLFPFGLGKWETATHIDRITNKSYQLYEMSKDWDYTLNMLLSVIMHLLLPAFILTVCNGLGVGKSSGSSSYSSSLSTSHRSRGNPSGSSADSRLPKEKTWVEDLWDRGGVSGSYYGHNGEFDRNDESRRVSEDMQQFHNSHPDADLSDHYYWDDIRDAETDDYLD